MESGIEGFLLPAGWRAILAAVCGLLTFVATTGGLFIVVPWVQSALVAGLAVGLVSMTPESSGLLGTLVGLAGVLVGPRNIFAPVVDSRFLGSGGTALVGAMVVCACTAYAVAFVRRRSHQAAGRFLLFGILLLLANLWFTTFMVNANFTPAYGGVTTPSFNRQLEGHFSASLANSDPVQFFRVYTGVKSGADFYAEYSKVWRAARGPAESIADFRVPLIFWLWAFLPKASSIVIAFLVLVSAAVLSLMLLRSSTVKMPLILPGAAVLASYFLDFTFNVTLFEQEEWAGAIGVIAFTMLAVSVRSRRWKLCTVVAVALAVLAALTREIMVCLLVAGFASSLIGDKAQRSVRTMAWAAGIVLSVGLYAVHWAEAQPYIVSTGQVPRIGYGSVAFMVAGLHYATSLLGQGGWLPWTLVAAGLVGAMTLRDLRVRAFATIATVLPLALFLLVGNNAWTPGSRGEVVQINYWGAGVLPLIYALIPCGLALIPGAGIRRGWVFEGAQATDPAGSARREKACSDHSEQAV